MDQFTIIKNICDLLQITEKEARTIIENAFNQEDSFNFLLDLFGYSNIDLIFQIFKIKEFFKSEEIREQQNDQAIYIEHVIPAGESIKETDKLIKTTTLGPNAKYFPYESLNLVQSAVFDDIYVGNDNVLISAPTGAGKTDIALLSILKALKHEKSQIIYIVPMKALANEIYNKYQKVFNGTLSVIEYTGDTEIDQQTASKARIIVCTPEKFDSATRKLCCVFEFIELIIIDEIHLLDDDRGPVIESLVARAFINSEIKQSKIRIIGLSATLPNYRDVADFIKAKCVHAFDSRYRPVPLKMTVTGFTKCSNYKDELDYLLMKVNEYLRIKKQVIVFVNSRLGTMKTAKFLIENLPKLKNKINEQLKTSGELLLLINSCIGIHHAGLLRKDRLLMERLFKEGKLKILVCTSTLAWGVNLPAYAVIIHGSTYYNTAKGMFDDISILDVLQIFGRAGRPQYDSKGEATLITSSNKIDKFIGLLKRSNDIESKLLFNFPESLNAEIYLNNITSMSTALLWIKNTFLYVRLMKSPAKYGIPFNELGLEEQALSEYIYLAIKLLEDCGLLKIHKKDPNYNTWKLETTVYGQISSIYYLNHLTMYQWLHDIHLIKDEFSLINLLLKSIEFQSISVRREEIPYLTNIHRDLLLDSIIDFDFDETVQSKLLILFISFLNFKKMPVFSLSCDTDFLIDNLKRLASAFSEMLLNLKRYDLFLILFLLQKQISRLKKEKLKNCLIEAVRINNNFIELQFNHSLSSFCVFIFADKNLIYAANLFGNCRHIVNCQINSISVQVHSNENWFFYEQNMKCKYSYSLKGLYDYGTHNCEHPFNVYGKRENCIHFSEMNLIKKLEIGLNIKNTLNNSKEQIPNDTDVKSDISQKSYKNITPQELCIINKFNFGKNTARIEETYNNYIDLNYVLKITFTCLESSYFKERLKAASMAIDALDLKKALIICPSFKDVKETQLFLNTKAALSDAGIINKYEIGISSNSSMCICTFKDALCIKENLFENVVFKSVSNLSGLFPVCEIFKIADNKTTIIFETKGNIEFLQSIYR